MGSIAESWFEVRLQQQVYHFPDQLVRPGRQAQRSEFPILLRDIDPPNGRESIALVTHRTDDAVDPAQRHAIHGLLRDPGRHRALVGVNTPVGQQIQLRVEQLPIQLLTRQTCSATFTQDTEHRFGALHFAYLLALIDVHHLCPFALRPGFPVLLGRS
jgi:hypothetical protein